MGVAIADTIRVATWHVELQRDGPGLLLRDILKDDDPGIAAVVEILDTVAPDVVLLTGIDWDLDMAALHALASRLSRKSSYDNIFALRPNSGMASGVDLDGDGRLGGPGDAQGYGRFAGNGGMAILSRLPVDTDGVRDFSGFLWADFPGAMLPQLDGAPFPSAEALGIQRLASTGHWDVPVAGPRGQSLHLLAFAAGPPVFDGPEDRNGRRNHDEVAFWSRFLGGDLPWAPPDAPVVVVGNANLDPSDGEGRSQAIVRLLANPRLQDPAPRSVGGARAATEQAGANAGQSGDPALDTADWSDKVGPGNLRVSYVLPDARLTVTDAGVFWPARGDPLRRLIDADGAPRHRLVWVDLEF